MVTVFDVTLTIVDMYVYYTCRIQYSNDTKTCNDRIMIQEKRFARVTTYCSTEKK